MREERSPFPLDGSLGERPSPPSPTLPPSRGKGGAHRPAAGSVARARRLRRDSTVAERILWKALRELKLNFRRQVPIGRFVIDFAHHQAKLLIEIDGYRHTVEERAKRDAARTDWLVSRGYRVIRFAEKDVRDDREEVVRQIIAAMTPFPLEGGRAGDGGGAVSWPEPVRADIDAMRGNDGGHIPGASVAERPSPPSPTLPPSRGKGEESANA
ncbi:MAG: endonuclease domain-containing protein [Caulobacteraceae bacterium]|nr:endonuclease domain-containing protein [Caulobacteraceae bacterium]